MATQSDLQLGKLVPRGRDIFLSHTGADKPWVEDLAELLERARFGDRYLGVVLDKWDFEIGKNVVLEIDRYIDECRFIALVVTKAFLDAEWPTLERTIAVGSDPSGRAGKVLVLLKENVQLPVYGSIFVIRRNLKTVCWISFRF